MNKIWFLLFIFYILISVSFAEGLTLSAYPGFKDLCVKPGENVTYEIKIRQDSLQDDWFGVNITDLGWNNFPGINTSGQILMRNKIFETAEVYFYPPANTTQKIYNVLFTLCPIAKSGNVGFITCIHAYLTLNVNESCTDNSSSLVENDINATNQTFKGRGVLLRVNPIWILINLFIILVIFAVYLRYSKD